MTGVRAAPRPAAEDRAFCAAMLPRVSRTFALCIRLLPHPLDHQVRVAYLLCRVADTVEDSPALTGDAKATLLAAFARALREDAARVPPLTEAFAAPASDDERLTGRADAVLRELARLPAAAARAIRPWVCEMCAGMAEFQRRDDAAGGSRLASLSTVDDLDRYCYYVAGTVGHLLTALFRLHDPAPDPARYARLEALATSFGRGLQLTNIIKDVWDDRRRGWSFVPRQLCELVGIRPEDLESDRHRAEARRVMQVLIEKAKVHLLDALDYSTSLPRRAYGIRLFCLTALYFAVRTLRLAERDTRLLDPAHKVKISRVEVVRTLLATRLLAPSNTLVRAYFRLLAGGDWRRPAEAPTGASPT